MQCTVVYQCSVQCSVSVSNSRSPVKGEACVADARQVRTGMPTLSVLHLWSALGLQ